MNPLPPLPDAVALETTRLSWQALAEHVVSAARYAVTKKIGMRAVEGGFGTPPFPTADSERRVLVVADDIVIDDDGHHRVGPVSTLRAAAAFVGVTPGAPRDIYAPSTALDLDAALPIDLEAARAFAAWFALGTAAFETIAADAAAGDDPSTIELWPEHFDVGLAIGNADANTRGTFGASPGDALHTEPYLYVTHWADVASDQFWNDPAFGGASVSYSEIARSSDPLDAALAFFRRGAAVLRGDRAYPNDNNRSSDTHGEGSA